MGLEDLNNLPRLTFLQTRMIGLNTAVQEAKIILRQTESKLPEMDECPYNILGYIIVMRDLT